MDFGTVAPDQLDSIDFALPKDPLSNTDVLKKGGGNTRFHIGAAKWGKKEWIGSLYSAGTMEKDFLSSYSKLLNAIEFNGFFYNYQPREVIERWVNSVGDDFRFCPKFPQAITHVKKLERCETGLKVFLEAISHFGKKLGPTLLMPHPQMDTGKRDIIRRFLRAIPGDIEVFLETRHPSWFAHGYDKEMLDFLTSERIGTVITDAAGRRDAVHMHLTKPSCFVRFVSNDLHPSDFARLDAWVGRLKYWQGAGLEHCYFFVQSTYEEHVPALLSYLAQQLNANCGTQFPTFGTLVAPRAK